VYGQAAACGDADSPLPTINAFIAFVEAYSLFDVTPVIVYDTQLAVSEIQKWNGGTSSECYFLSPNNIKGTPARLAVIPTNVVLNFLLWDYQGLANCWRGGTWGINDSPINNVPTISVPMYKSWWCEPEGRMATTGLAVMVHEFIHSLGGMGYGAAPDVDQCPPDPEHPDDYQTCYVNSLAAITQEMYYLISYVPTNSYPYSIEGTIRINGTIQPGMVVTVQNLTTGLSRTAVTDEYGRYFYDDIQDRWIQAEQGDSIRVCTPTSGVSSVTFTAGAATEKVVDIDYLLHPTPEWPYSIEGTVVYYDVPQNDLTVTVRNLTKGTSGICKTDLSGHYVYDDIGDSVILSEPGDLINVGTPDGATESFVAIDTEEKSIDFINIVMWGGLWKIIVTPVDGSPYTFYDNDGVLGWCKLMLQVDGMGSFDIDLINQSGAYTSIFDIGDTVEVWLDSELGVIGSTKRLMGSIKNVSYARDGVLNTITLSGFDLMDTFKRVVVNEIYSGTRTYEDVITNTYDGLLALYAPTIIGSGVRTTGLTLLATDTLKFPRVYLYECLTRIRESAGDWVFNVSPTRVLNLEPRGYVDPGKTIVISASVRSVKFDYDDDNMANSVIVEGGTISNLQSKKAWTATASTNPRYAHFAYDGNFQTGWETWAFQAAGQWYSLDLGGVMIIGKMFINHMTAHPDRYPRSFIVYASTQNTSDDLWDEIVNVSNNTEPDVIVTFPSNYYRYIKIVLNNTEIITSSWSIGEINIYTYYPILAKYSDLASIAEHGLYEDPIKDNSITSKGAAFSRAVSEVQTRKEPTITGGKISIPYYFNINQNELVSIVVPGTPINQKFVVQKVTFSEGSKGSFKEDIELKAIS
jgi:hypothetical protein